jgi:hypothetical protein
MSENRHFEAQGATYGAAQGTVQPDEVNAGLIGMIGAFSVVVFVLIVLLLVAWFYNWRQELAGSRFVPSNDPQMPLGRMLVEHSEQLGSYRWINRDAQVRAIPIERAMQVVAGELAAAQKSAAAPATGRKP